MRDVSSHPYNVPLIPPDLRREECIHQIADALDYLDKVADDVFNRISVKVTENKQRLQKVNDRINTAQLKIDKIKGTNKATKIFSSAKYPAPNELENYETLFGVKKDLQQVRRSHRHLTSKHQEVDETVLKEKVQFYNVHIVAKKKDEDSQVEGLGRLPRNIPSVSSLLLFNTAENPYKKYVMFDPLGVVTKTRKNQAEDEDEGPAAAPTSITHGEQMQRAQADNYFYSPVLGEVPDIAVPDFLPSLSGVADDMLFSDESGGTIAPSVPFAMPDLPSVDHDLDSLPVGPTSGGLPDISSGPPPSAAAPPPPPPVPAQVAPPPPPPPSAAPPPPPPPPPPADAGAQPPKPPEVKSPEASAPATGDGRANLMDAIRAAGGLKSVSGGGKRKKVKEIEPPIPPPSAGGGDLMSELQRNLGRRRIGISGNRNAEAPSTNRNPLDSMRGMIPVTQGAEPDDDDNPDWESD